MRRISQQEWENEHMHNPMTEGEALAVEAFQNAMEAEYGYRPQVFATGVLMNSRDADRYEGWKLALAAHTAASGGEAKGDRLAIRMLVAAGFVTEALAAQHQEPTTPGDDAAGGGFDDPAYSFGANPYEEPRS